MRQGMKKISTSRGQTCPVQIVPMNSKKEKGLSKNETQRRTDYFLLAERKTEMISAVEKGLTNSSNKSTPKAEKTRKAENRMTD